MQKPGNNNNIKADNYEIVMLPATQTLIKITCRYNKALKVNKICL